MSTPLIITLCALGTWCTVPVATSTRVLRRCVGWREKTKQLASHPGAIIGLLAVVVAVSFRQVITVVVPLALAVALVGGTIGYLVRRQRIRRRYAWQRVDMSSALGIAIGELQAGAQLQQALKTASAQVTEPQLRHALTAVALQQTPSDSADIPAIELLQSGRQISETTGMSLVGILRHIRDRLDQEQRHQARTTAALGGAKTTAVILAILPVCGLLMGFALGVNSIAILLNTGIGNLLLIAGLGAECAGLVWNNRIIERAAQ